MNGPEHDPGRLHLGGHKGNMDQHLHTGNLHADHARIVTALPEWRGQALRLQKVL